MNNKLINKLKKNYKVIGFIFILFSLMEPDYFTSLKFVHSYYVAMRIVTFTLAIVYFWFKRQIPFITIIMIIYYFIYGYSTYINGTSLYYLVSSSVYIISFVAWIEIVLRNYPLKGLFSLNIVFSVLVYVNLVLFLLFPDGYIQTPTANGSLVTRHFLGVYNQFAGILIPAIIINVIYTNLRYGKLNYKSYLLFTAVIFSFVYFWSATSIIGIALIVFYLLFIHRKKLDLFINYKVILISIVALYIIILSFDNISFLSFIVEDLLNKDLTFSSRTIIWDKAIEMIKEAPYFGYGYLEGSRYVTLNSGLERDAHNSVLQYMLQHGIIGFIPLILLIVLFFKNTSKIDSNYLVKFTLYSFFVSASMMIAEVYSFKFLLLILMLGIFMPEICASKENNKHENLLRDNYEK